MKRIYKSLFLVLAALFSFSFAFAETGSETELTASGGASSNAQVDGQSFYIDGSYIAGKGALQKGDMTSKGFKLRTGTDGNRAIFTVNTNYTITSLVINGIANYNAKTEGAAIVVTKVEVDGVETDFTGGEFPGKAADTSGSLTISGINAQQSIAIYFDNSNADGNQINAAWIVDWERPDVSQPTITVSPKAISLIPGATSKVSAKVDPNTFATAWVSDNETVATVAEDGTVTAVAAGVANIINRWDSHEEVADTAVVTVADFDPAKYEIVKQFDFTTMGEVTLTIESEAAANIWNQANKKVNPVFYCTNEGLEDIAIQAVLSSGGKGWSITEAGLTLGSGAGRCAAIGHLYAGQVVEIIYTGSEFYTGSKEDATMKDDGAVKTALNEGVGRAIYRMKEAGMLGFEITKGKAIEKIIVYQAIVPEIVNANFEADEPIATKICTYAKDVQEGQVANMQPLTGWTIVENGDARAAGTFAYGSNAILGGDGGTVPAVGPNGETEGKALGIEAVWSATTQYTQEITLPAGEYLMEAVIYNAAGTGALSANLIGINEVYSTVKNYPVGKWTKDQIKFTLGEEKTVTISLGVNSGNVGNGSAPHLFIDHIKLYSNDEIAAVELAAAKENALIKIDGLPVGEGFFLYNETAINDAKAAVIAAETIEAVDAAVAAALAAINKPAADKEYVITNKTAELALMIGNGAVNIEKDGIVKFAEVEGGWVLSNNLETPEYVFKTIGNTWTLSTTTNKDEAYVVNFNLVDGAYTIQGANGLFGTDAIDDGSAVYANKAQSNNGLWLIAEYAPEPVETDYTDYIVNADLTTADAGFDATGTKGIDGSGIVKVGNAAAFDFKQTIENLPAGKYKVTAQAAYRYGADEAAEYEAITTSDAVTKLVQLYATVGTKTVGQPVQNRYDGASETDLAGSGAVVIDGKYVPNSSSAVKAWFDAGMYVNEVEFNLPADGAVTIGINRLATPESDYTVIGPWTLTRLGDAEQEPEPEPQPGDDMTKFIVNNSFETGNTNGWTYEASTDHGAKRNDNPTYTMTNCDGDYLFNIWSSGNAISQTIENIPNGTYKLQAVIATDGGHKVQLNANDKNVQIDAIDKGTGIEAELEFLVLQNKATIGAEGVDKYWYKVDNFRLTYLKAFDINDLIAAYNDALAAAQALDGKMNAEVKTALTAAIAAEVDKTNADALTAATAALAEATANAKASIAAYANAAKYLPVNKAELENTNVYTAEAYKENITDVEAGYEDGTLTDAKANSLTDVRTGWRAENYIDDILMSAWDANVMDWDTYHVNTWSTEGDGDGSNFTVPFIEYWTGDGDSLGEKTLTATMSGLQKGIYDVTAWVRVRIKNGAEAPAAGIFFQANDSEGVSVVGDQFGSSQFYLKEVATKGEVVADGVLNIKFNVAAGNNISWLAFKNVKFAFNEEATNGIMNVNVNKQPETIYNLRGQRVEKAVKGLYIINGKKTVVK